MLSRRCWSPPHRLPRSLPPHLPRPAAGPLHGHRRRSVRPGSATDIVPDFFSTKGRQKRVKCSPSYCRTVLKAGSVTRGTRANAVPVVRVFKNDAPELALHALWMTLRSDVHRIGGFFPKNNRNFFSGGYTARPPQSPQPCTGVQWILRNMTFPKCQCTGPDHPSGW